MTYPDDKYDFFVSYARADNTQGWVEEFVAALVEEHRQFTGGRELRYFFDRQDIANFSSWETEIFQKGLTRSRLFLAFLSPRYFASEICRREWKAWIDQEIARHILTAGAAPIYFVEVPGFVSKPSLPEQEVARNVAELCELAAPLDRYLADVEPVLRECRRRQLVTWLQDNAVQPFCFAGKFALRQADLRGVLQKLAQDLDTRAEHARRAAESETTVPPYNRKFTGRLDELLKLRRMLTDDRTGVVCGVAGLGGIGKTELAYTYAHAFAGDYPGGRFHVPCEHAENLCQAAVVLGDLFRDQISDDERMQPERHFAAIVRCLRRRLAERGHILLVLDNVTRPGLVAPAETDALTALGSGLHLLATTRLRPTAERGWLTLGELSPDDGLDLLEKHRAIASDVERQAARSIVRRLGGFTLALELVAAYLAAHPELTCDTLADGLGLEDIEQIAGDAPEDAPLRRHNHERQLTAVLTPVLSGLTPSERRTLEYAALLAPDQVPLPWLEPLVQNDFPELAQPARLGPAWGDVWRKLVRLALLTPGEGETDPPRILRIHRLVQELVQQKVSPDTRSHQQDAISVLVEARTLFLERAIDYGAAQWELAPLGTLAEWTQAEPLCRRVLAICEATYGPNDLRVVSSLNALAAVLCAKNRTKEAEPLYRQALSILELACGPDHTQVARLLNNLAQVLRSTGRVAEAEPLMRRSLAIDEAAYGSDHLNVAIRLSNFASMLRTSNRPIDAEPLMRRALAINEAALGPDHPKVATDLNNLAGLLQDTNRLAEAEPLIRRAIEITRAAYGPGHPAMATSLNNLAQLLRATNRLAEAESLMRRALAIEEAAYGPAHPRVATGLNNLAKLLQARNRFAEAEPIYRSALQINESAYGPDHPEVAICLNNLALLFHCTDRLFDAEPLYRRALNIDEAVYGPQHPIVATCLNNLAQLLQAVNRSTEAEPLYRRLLEIDHNAYGPEHLSVARDLNNLAALLKATNRPAEAEPLYRRALAIAEGACGPEHPSVVMVLNNLAELLQATNRPAEAKPLSLRVAEILLQSTATTSRPHPHLSAAIDNYANLLRAQGHDEAEIGRQLYTLLARYGISLG